MHNHIYYFYVCMWRRPDRVYDHQVQVDRVLMEAEANLSHRNITYDMKGA